MKRDNRIWAVIGFQIMAIGALLKYLRSLAERVQAGETFPQSSEGLWFATIALAFLASIATALWIWLRPIKT